MPPSKQTKRRFVADKMAAVARAPPLRAALHAFATRTYGAEFVAFRERYAALRALKRRAALADAAAQAEALLAACVRARAPQQLPLPVAERLAIEEVRALLALCLRYRVVFETHFSLYFFSLCLAIVSAFRSLSLPLTLVLLHLTV